MEAALARLARQAANSAGLYRFFLYLAIALPPGLTLFPAVESGNWNYFFAASGFSLGLILFAFAYQHSLRRELRRSLGESGLYLRLALDGFEHDPIFERSPWPWRSMLPRNSPKSLLPTLRRVAGNLDFYLGDTRFQLWPSRLILALLWAGGLLLSVPLTWFAVHYCSLLRIALSRSGQGGFGILGPVDTQFWQQLALWMLFALVLAFWNFRRQVWTEELVDYLQASLRD